MKRDLCAGSAAGSGRSAAGRFSSRVAGLTWGFVLVALAAAGCGDDPGSPDVRMRLSIAPAGGDTLRVTAEVRNVGDGAAVYHLYQGYCSGTMQFTVRDGSGNTVVIENPCVIGPMEMPCFARSLSLDPGAEYAEGVSISGIYWPADTCEPELLPPGTYTVEVLFTYQAESEPDGTYRTAGRSLSFEITR